MLVVIDLTSSSPPSSQERGGLGGQMSCGNGYRRDPLAAIQSNRARDSHVLISISSQSDAEEGPPTTCSRRSNGGGDDDGEDDQTTRSQPHQEEGQNEGKEEEEEKSVLNLRRHLSCFVKRVDVVVAGQRGGLHATRSHPITPMSFPRESKWCRRTNFASLVSASNSGQYAESSSSSLSSSLSSALPAVSSSNSPRYITLVTQILAEAGDIEVTNNFPPSPGRNARRFYELLQRLATKPKTGLPEGKPHRLEDTAASEIYADEGAVSFKHENFKSKRVRKAPKGLKGLKASTTLKAPKPSRPPKPAPLDISKISNWKFSVLVMCPLCSLTLPPRQTPPTRRRHLALCGALKGLTAQTTHEVLEAEVARLDKLDQLKRFRALQQQSAWQEVLRGCGLPFRDIEEEEMWTMLGVPENSERRRKEKEARKTVNPTKTARPGARLTDQAQSAASVHSPFELSDVLENDELSRKWRRIEGKTGIQKRVCILQRHTGESRRQAFGRMRKILASHREIERRIAMLTAAIETENYWRFKPSRLAVRKGPGPRAGFGLGFQFDADASTMCSVDD